MELESTGPTADLAAGFAGGRRLWEGTPSRWAREDSSALEGTPSPWAREDSSALGGHTLPLGSGGRGRSGRKWKTTRIAQAHQNVLLGKDPDGIDLSALTEEKERTRLGVMGRFPEE